MDDIEVGKIDCIVVYKVDRLSRSLLDFSKIMGTFDANHVAFVSVTQQFSTTSSMGRLTLNILLSFAQFEREIISERTRDKMQAARKKGQWLGGWPILGYDIVSGGGRVEINKVEAGKVQEIFELYLKLGGLVPTVKELNHRGWLAKEWITRKGKRRGGQPFDKFTLYRMLTNVAYIGKVRYKKEMYPGQHSAIVDEALFQQVQETLQRHGRVGNPLSRNKYGALLRGLIHCHPPSAPVPPPAPSSSPAPPSKPLPSSPPARLLFAAIRASSQTTAPPPPTGRPATAAPSPTDTPRPAPPVPRSGVPPAPLPPRTSPMPAPGRSSPPSQFPAPSAPSAAPPAPPPPPSPPGAPPRVPETPPSAPADTLSASPPEPRTPAPPASAISSPPPTPPTPSGP